VMIVLEYCTALIAEVKTNDLLWCRLWTL